MLKKIKEILKRQKGQGVVEYALILGFVAVIAVYMLTGSGLKDSLKTNIDNANAVATSIDYEYKKANNQVIENVGGQNGSGFQPGSNIFP